MVVASPWTETKSYLLDLDKEGTAAAEKGFEAYIEVAQSETSLHFLGNIVVGFQADLFFPNQEIALMIHYLQSLLPEAHLQQVYLTDLKF